MVCGWCKREFHGPTSYYANISFCGYSCMDAYKKAYCSKPESSGGAASVSSGGSSSGISTGDGLGMAAAGIGAAAAGVGAGAKAIGAGAGAALKGVGSILGGVASVGQAVGKQVGGEFNKTGSAEDQIRAIQNMQMSSDPEEYKNQIFQLFDKATSKPADPLRDTFVIKAAKNKIIHELDMMKIKNPEQFAQYSAMYEQLNKKKKFFGLFG